MVDIYSQFVPVDSTPHIGKNEKIFIFYIDAVYYNMCKCNGGGNEGG